MKIQLKENMSSVKSSNLLIVNKDLLSHSLIADSYSAISGHQFIPILVSVDHDIVHGLFADLFSPL